MPPVRLLVGSPPVGTSDTGLRPPLWAPSQLCSLVSSPWHDAQAPTLGATGRGHGGHLVVRLSDNLLFTKGPKHSVRYGRITESKDKL